MKKLFAVEISSIVIVHAEDDKDALMIAEDQVRDICRDTYEFEYSNLGSEIKTVKELRTYGWEKECLPYGGENNQTIEEILNEKERTETENETKLLT